MDQFTIGKAQVRRVEELSIRLPFDMFGASDEMVAANAGWLKPAWLGNDGNWDMVVQSWIVIVDDRVIVVDPCVGNGRSLPAFEIFDQLDTPFIERFAACGISPELVDAVVCTHLHSDHCGWNTVLRDGKYVPTFPNARYFMGKREVERWDYRLPGYNHIPENASIFENSVLPILEAGLAEVIGDSHAISPSLHAELADGHTLGHMALHLTSGERHGWFTGDAFHHPIELLHPELDEHSCENYPLTVATRERLISAFIAQGALIIPAHFTAPHAGYLRETNGTRQFEPLASKQA
ncbi:MAG: MBL fold metallo-hydrolase [Novosphingobium sp.]|nr:MBL fold metallo-hydrolase [Novosphingobium sp.]